MGRYFQHNIEQGGDDSIAVALGVIGGMFFEFHASGGPLLVSFGATVNNGGAASSQVVLVCERDEDPALPSKTIKALVPAGADVTLWATYLLELAAGPHNLRLRASASGAVDKVVRDSTAYITVIELNVQEASDRIEGPRV